MPTWGPQHWAFLLAIIGILLLFGEVLIPSAGVIFITAIACLAGCRVLRLAGVVDQRPGLLLGVCGGIGDHAAHGGVLDVEVVGAGLISRRRSRTTNDQDFARGGIETADREKGPHRFSVDARRYRARRRRTHSCFQRGDDRRSRRADPRRRRPFQSADCARGRRGRRSEMPIWIPSKQRTGRLMNRLTLTCQRSKQQSGRLALPWAPRSFSIERMTDHEPVRRRHFLPLDDHHWFGGLLWRHLADGGFCPLRQFVDSMQNDAGRGRPVQLGEDEPAKDQSHRDRPQQDHGGSGATPLRRSAPAPWRRTIWRGATCRG